MEENLTTQAVYYWNQLFLPGVTVIEHRYTPVDEGPSLGESSCRPPYLPLPDASHVAALEVGFQHILGFILLTAKNWSGPIGVFHLTVDAHDAGGLCVSTGFPLTETAPMRFEATLDHFVPRQDLSIDFRYND